MIAPKDSIDSQSTETPLPNGASGASDIEGKAATASGERDGRRSSFNSKKTYVAGKLHTDIRVPFRGNFVRTDEIDQRQDGGYCGGFPNIFPKETGAGVEQGRPGGG